MRTVPTGGLDGAKCGMRSDAHEKGEYPVWIPPSKPSKRCFGQPHMARVIFPVAGSVSMVTRSCRRSMVTPSPGLI